MYSKSSDSLSERQLTEPRRAKRTFGWKPVYDTSKLNSQQTVSNKTPSKVTSVAKTSSSWQENGVNQRNQLSGLPTKKRASDAVMNPSLSPASSRQLSYQPKRDRRSPLPANPISPRATVSTPIQSRASLRSDAASPSSVHSRSNLPSTSLFSPTRSTHRSNTFSPPASPSPSPSIRSRATVPVSVPPPSLSPRVSVTPNRTRFASRSNVSSPATSVHSRPTEPPLLQSSPISRLSTPRLVRHTQTAPESVSEIEMTFPPAIPADLQARFQSESIIELTEQPVRGSLFAAVRCLEELEATCSAAAVMRIHNPPTKLRNRIEELDGIMNTVHRALERAVRIRNE